MEFIRKVPLPMPGSRPKLPLALDGAPMLPPMDTPVGDDALLWLWYEGQINSDVLAARRLGSPELSRNRRRRYRD